MAGYWMSLGFEEEERDDAPTQGRSHHHGPGCGGAGRVPGRTRIGRGGRRTAASARYPSKISCTLDESSSLTVGATAKYDSTDAAPEYDVLATNKNSYETLRRANEMASAMAWLTNPQEIISQEPTTASKASSEECESIFNSADFKKFLGTTTTTADISTSEPNTTLDELFDSADFQKFLCTIPSEQPESSTYSGMYNSADFKKFLTGCDGDNTNKRIRRNTTTRTNSNASLSDLFKSKDSFSNFFSSMDWQLQKTDINEKIKEDPVIEPLPSFYEEQDQYFRSKDWITQKNLGDHVDVPYYSPQELFNSSEESSDCVGENQNFEGPQGELPTSNKTNWGDMFYSQLDHAPAAATDIKDDFRIPTLAEEQQQSKKVSDVANHIATAGRKRKQQAALKKKGKKKEAPEKEYVYKPTDLDVLLGRGGKSNHHPGNKRYREEVKNFQASYLQLSNKEDKTELTRFVVDYVHKYNGRFLSLDKDVIPPLWYVVPDVVARRKVSQALREDGDPVKRAEKRARFLKKKKAKANGL